MLLLSSLPVAAAVAAVDLAKAAFARVLVASTDNVAADVLAAALTDDRSHVCRLCSL